MTVVVVYLANKFSPSLFNVEMTRAPWTGKQWRSVVGPRFKNLTGTLRAPPRPASSTACLQLAYGTMQ